MSVTGGKANRDLICESCKKAIHKGESCVSISYRERAVSYREAAHAGSWAVTRYRRYHYGCSPVEVPPRTHTEADRETIIAAAARAR